MEKMLRSLVLATFVVASLFLYSCSFSGGEEKEAEETLAPQAEESVELIDGTPAEKADAYNQKQKMLSSSSSN